MPIAAANSFFTLCVSSRRSSRSLEIIGSPKLPPSRHTPVISIGKWRISSFVLIVNASLVGGKESDVNCCETSQMVPARSDSAVPFCWEQSSLAQIKLDCPRRWLHLSWWGGTISKPMAASSAP
jgi:hypothetical protein